MKIIQMALHAIDHTGNKTTYLDVSNENNDLNDYISELLSKISNMGSKRKFVFESNSTEIKSVIDRILAGENYKQEAEKAAIRLLNKEKDAQETIDHLKHEIQKGVLVQAYIEVNGEKRIIISKADHNQYLDDKELKQRRGLPIKKKIYKAFMVQYDIKNNIENLYVYDTNTHISRYWWKDFLELNEVTTDEDNTETAFDLIARGILGKLKEEFPSDHSILRNRVLGYFKSSPTFEMEDFIENAIGNYEPVNKNFNVQDLTAKIRSLPSKKGIDSQFTLTPSVIKAKKLKEIYPLNENIDLHINDYVGNLEDIIEAVKIKNQKYIRIRTDAGYDAFKTN
jgi:hypothetical protein